AQHHRQPQLQKRSAKRREEQRQELREQAHRHAVRQRQEDQPRLPKSDQQPQRGDPLVPRNAPFVRVQLQRLQKLRPPTAVRFGDLEQRQNRHRAARHHKNAQRLLAVASENEILFQAQREQKQLIQKQPDGRNAHQHRQRPPQRDQVHAAETRTEPQ